MQSTNGSSLYNPAQRVFLVRHAERFNDSRDDPPLTAEGEERAEALARYTARRRHYRNHQLTMDARQRHRATPGGPAELTPEVIPTLDPAHEYFQATANAVRRLGNDTILVVGHITIPNIIAELGGPQLSTICETVFSDLFLLIPAPGWDGLIRLRCGAGEEISPRCRNLGDLRLDRN